MKLTEEQMTDAMHDFIRGCDADDLARLAGEMFGGDCSFGGVEPWDYEKKTGGEYLYDFVPDENYNGAFGKIKN